MTDNFILNLEIFLLVIFLIQRPNSDSTHKKIYKNTFLNLNFEWGCRIIPDIPFPGGFIHSYFDLGY